MKMENGSKQIQARKILEVDSMVDAHTIAQVIEIFW